MLVHEPSPANFNANGIPELAIDPSQLEDAINIMRRIYSLLLKNSKIEPSFEEIFLFANDVRLERNNRSKSFSKKIQTLPLQGSGRQKFSPRRKP